MVVVEEAADAAPGQTTTMRMRLSRLLFQGWTQQRTLMRAVGAPVRPCSQKWPSCTCSTKWAELTA